MAQDPKIRASVRPTNRPDAIAAALQNKLEGEAQVLESLVANLSRGHPLPELWALLHEAAVRDGRVPALAFAYERLTQDPKFKFLPSSVQSEILMHAAKFFANVFGDLPASTGYLDQVLALNPTHPEAFAQMEAVLIETGKGLKLAEVYAAAAMHRPEKDEQLRLLRRAAELADEFSEEHEGAIKIYQNLLRVDPSDKKVRHSLEERLRQAGKLRELARLLEHVVSSPTGLTPEEVFAVRERLLALYSSDLNEPERAMPHIEEILQADPSHERARGTAHRLISHKSVAGRAANALADAYQRLGTHHESAAMLEIALETLRGQKRAEAQKRLGILKQDLLGDAAGAHLLFEAVVTSDPADDEVLRRYGELSRELGKGPEAARVLLRAATTMKDAGLKARVGTEVGAIFLAAGDTKRARSALAGVIESVGEDHPAALDAARSLAQLYDETKEVQPLAHTLELLLRIETDVTARCAVAERMARLAEDELRDQARAIAAWRWLLGSPLHERALEALERLYTATESFPELVEILETRSELATDAALARSLALRAAELRTDHTKGRARTIGAWIEFLADYGPSREVHARIIPLLEEEKAWDKLAAILAQDAMQAPESERVPILLKLAHLRLSRLANPRGAVEAYQQVWELDPKEPTTKQALEKLLTSPEARLAAATLLEPVYRQEGSSARLLRVLEIRAEGVPDARASIALYDEAAAIAEQDKHDPKQALEFAGRALRRACEVDPASVGERLAALEKLAGAAGDLERYGALLREALGTEPIDHPVLADLAKRAGEVLVSAGDPAGALSMFRRALAFEPSSPALLARIDALLAEEGRPQERVVLYRAALAQEKWPERRRELYHQIGTIERRDLGNARAAIDTWRQALLEDPTDRVAYTELLEAYEAAREWPALYRELSKSLASADGERKSGILVMMGELAAEMGDKRRALEHYRELLESGFGTDEVLSALEKLATSPSDLAVVEELLKKRIATATEPLATCAWLERLGALQGERLGETAKAAASFKRAASLAERNLADDDRARALFERVLSVAPKDVEAAERLCNLYVRAELWDRLPGVMAVLVENATDEAQAVRRLLELEPYVRREQGARTWLLLADGLPSSGVGDREIAFARAKVLGVDPDRRDEAAAEFRRLMATANEEEASRIVAAFDALLATLGPSERPHDRRFLFTHKADQASDQERIGVLFAWAEVEESVLSDPKAAATVYRRILSLQPGQADALAALSRVLVAMGDAEGALEALTLLRDSSDGATRRQRDLEIAELLISKLGRSLEALAQVAPLVEAGPPDAVALGIVYRALQDRASQEKAAALLEHAASGAGDDRQKLVILKTLLDMPKIAGLEEARQRWFERALDIYEAEPEFALETALAAVAELPQAETLWLRAEKLARLLDRADLVAEAYRRALDLPLDSAVAAMVGKRAVDYREEWFDDPEAVIVLLRRVVDLAPEATWALDRLKLAYGSAERWDDLFAVYDDAIGRAADDASRADLLAEAAQAAKDFASDAERAIGYFERLFTLRPNDARVRTLLERLYEKRGKIEPLIDLLYAGLPSLAGEKAQLMRLRIAGLFLRGRRDEAASFKLIEDVLREDPARAEAFVLLEDIVLGTPAEVSHPPSKTATGETVDPDGVSPAAEVVATGATKSKRRKRTPQVRERAASMLKERYRAEARHHDLAKILEVELSLATGAKERARLEQELLSLKRDTLKDDQGAFEHAVALLALEPRVVAHREVLSELAGRLSAWERFAEALVKTAEAASEAALVARLLIEAAEIYRDKVERADRAIDLFASVLSLDPKDKAVTLSTAHELDSLLRRAGRAEERCAVLETIATLELDPAARRAALSELSRVALAEIGDPGRAARAWRAHVEDGNVDIEDLNGLIAALRGADQHGELVSALLRRAEVAPPHQAREDRVEIARVYAGLGAMEEAIAAWLRVRRDFGVGPDTFAALADLYEWGSRWEELARLVLEEAMGLLAKSTVPGVELRLGDVKGRAELSLPQLRDRPLAVEVCKALLDAGIACWVSPLSDDPSTEAARCWAETTWWALDELVRIALEDHDYEAAVRGMLEGSQIIFDLDRARRMRSQAAVVASEHLGNAQRAVAIYRELLVENENDAVAAAVIPELARLLGQLGAFGDLTDLWEQQATRHPENPALSAELWARAAELSENRLADNDRAILDYRQSADAGSEKALRELARLYAKAGDHLKAAEALEGLSYRESQEHLTADTTALVDAYLAAGHRDRARASLEKAVRIAVEPKALRIRLRLFYAEESDFDSLADLAGIEAQEAEDKPTKLRLLREAAALHLEKRNDPGAAIPLLEQARKLDPDDHSIGIILTRALSATSRFEDASVVLRAELKSYGNRKPKERALVHFELSRVFLKMDERARALAELDLAAKIDPAHPSILYSLGKLAAEEGQLDRAQRTFRALLLVLGRSDFNAPVEIGRGVVLFELATLARMEEDLDRADELVESALHAAGENEGEAKAFERALSQRGSYDILARSLETRLAASVGADARAVILRDLAAVHCEHLGLGSEVRARLSSLAEQIARELRDTPGLAPAAWMALETVYERIGEPDRQAEVLEQLASAERPTSSAEVDALYRLAKLRLAKAETLFVGASLLSRALEADAQPRRAADALVKALEIDPQNEQIVRLYERVSRGKGREAARADALLRLIALGAATVEEEREAVAVALDGPEPALAESLLERILEHEAKLGASQVVWAKAMLGELCARKGDLKRAADLKEQAAEQASPDERRALLLEVARSASDDLGELGRAARIYLALREHEPAKEEIWAPLLEIYRRLDATDLLTALICDTLPLIDSAAKRNRLRLELATALLAKAETDPQAVDLLQQVLEDDPTHVDAAMLLSGILEKAGRTDELATLLARQLDAAKDRGDAESIGSLSMRLGTLLEEGGRAAEALDVHRSALDWDPKSKTSLYAVVRLSEVRGDPFEIADALEKLIGVETGEAAARAAMQLHTIRSEQGDLDLADRALEAGLRAHPSSAELSELLMARYQTRGAFNELAALLKQGFDRAPENLTLLPALLEAYRKLGAFDAALDAVSAALQVLPNDASLYHERATLHETLGMTPKALSDFESAFSVGGADHLQYYVQALKREAARAEPPLDRLVKLKLSEVLCTTGFTDAGRTHLTELLKRDPKDTVVLHALAQLESREERWDAASATYRRLLSLEEGEALVETALGLAEACERASRLADARSGLELASRAAPDNAAVSGRLRDLYEKTGAYGALAQLILADAERESEVSPRFGLLLQAAGLLIAEGGDPEQAIRVLDEARDLRPDDDEAVLLLGRAYAAQGREQEALELFQSTALQRKGKRSKHLSAMHREISRIHLQEGDLSKALEALTRAFDMNLQNGEIALELGLLAKDLDDQELAARAFRSVTFMKAAPAGAGDGATPAAKGLSYFFLGQMARQRGDVRKARLLAEKAVIEDPGLEQARALLEELKSA